MSFGNSIFEFMLIGLRTFAASAAQNFRVLRVHRKLSTIAGRLIWISTFRDGPIYNAHTSEQFVLFVDNSSLEVTVVYSFSRHSPGLKYGKSQHLVVLVVN